MSDSRIAGDHNVARQPQEQSVGYNAGSSVQLCRKLDGCLNRSEVAVQYQVALISSEWLIVGPLAQMDGRTQRCQVGGLGAPTEGDHLHGDGPTCAQHWR